MKVMMLLTAMKEANVHVKNSQLDLNVMNVVKQRLVYHNLILVGVQDVSVSVGHKNVYKIH